MPGRLLGKKPILMVEHEAGEGKEQQEREPEQREVHAQRSRPFDGETMSLNHGSFFLPYSMTVSPVSALLSSLRVVGSGPHVSLPVWRTSLPCSRWTSTCTV